MSCWVKNREATEPSPVYYYLFMGLTCFPGGPVVTHLPVQERSEAQVPSLSQEGPLEEGMATHSSILAWRIPWTEEPGRLQSIGSQRVGHK